MQLESWLPALLPDVSCFMALAVSSGLYFGMFG